MPAAAERLVTYVAALDVEALGLRVCVRVVVCSGERKSDAGALMQRTSFDTRLDQYCSAGLCDGRIEAQHVFDAVRNEFRCLRNIASCSGCSSSALTPYFFLSYKSMYDGEQRCAGRRGRFYLQSA